MRTVLLLLYGRERYTVDIGDANGPLAGTEAITVEAANWPLSGAKAITFEAIGLAARYNMFAKLRV